MITYCAILTSNRKVQRGYFKKINSGTVDDIFMNSFYELCCAAPITTHCNTNTDSHRKMS